MTELQDLLNVGPEEQYLDPWDLQQVISWKKGYPGSGGAFKFLNTNDQVVLRFIQGSGLFATPDDGTSGNLGRVLVDGYHSFVGLIVETAVDPTTLKSTWAVCDGTLGTPDLRGLFIIGAGPGYGVSTTGGAASFNNAHQHTLAHHHPHHHSGTSLVGPTHTHGAGSYLDGDHQHSAGTLSGPSHSHTSQAHDHTLASHTHTASNHSHGLSDHDHTAGGYELAGGHVTGGPSTTSNRSDGANSVASASHDHSIPNVPLSGESGSAHFVSGGADFNTTQDKTGFVTNGPSPTDSGGANYSGSPSLSGTGAVTGTGGLMTATSAVTGTSGNQSSTSISGDTGNDTFGVESPVSADVTYTGMTGSNPQSILPPYMALYRVMRVA